MPQFDLDLATPVDSNLRLSEALALLQQGKVAEAKAMVQRLLSTDANLAAGHEVLGVILAREGNPDGAMAAFQHAVQLNPRQSSAITKEGDVLAALGHQDQAKERFLQALSIDPGDRHASQRLGLIAEADGNIPEAIARYERGLEGTPDGYLGVKLNLALLYNQIGEYSKAEALLTPFAAAAAPHPIVLRALANASLGQGRFEEAAEGYRATLAIVPQDDAAGLGLAIALRDGGNTDAALEQLRALIAANPADEDSVVALYATLQSAGRPEEALAGLEAAVAASPDSLRLRRTLSGAYLADGNTDRAVGLWQSLIDSGAQAEVPYMEIAALRQSTGDFAGAEQAYAQLNTRFPGNVAGLTALASLRGLQQDYAAALTGYTQVLAIDPEHAGALRGAAAAATRLGDRARGLDYAARLVALPGAGVEEYFLQGMLLEGVGGRAPTAVESYRAALALNPDHWPSLNNLAMLEAGQGDLSDAVGLAERAVAVAPGNPIVLDTLGTLQMRAGRSAAAAETLGRAVELAPENPAYQFHLARVRAVLGEKEEARRLIGIALDKAPEGPLRDQIEAFGKGL